MLVQVIFSLGSWVVDTGIYRLIGCPPGHALVSSLDGNSFTQEAQRCEKCGIDHYITNTNSSLVVCQPCPAGATCDGSELRPRVAESIWQISNLSGQYILVSCPPGFELYNKAGDSFSHAVQQCNLCPSKYYCPGGSAIRLPCPDGRFSPVGSSAAAKCSTVVILEAVVALAMSMTDFDEKGKLSFLTVLAYTCEVAIDYVMITSINPAHRTTASSIEVVALSFQSEFIQRISDLSRLQVILEVATRDESSAASARSKLLEEPLENKLQSLGLPRGKVLSSVIKVYPCIGRTSN
jgi:hypothetical protein